MQIMKVYFTQNMYPHNYALCRSKIKMDKHTRHTGISLFLMLLEQKCPYNYNRGVLISGVKCKKTLHTSLRQQNTADCPDKRRHYYYTASAVAVCKNVRLYKTNKNLRSHKARAIFISPKAELKVAIIIINYTWRFASQ